MNRRPFIAAAGAFGAVAGAGCLATITGDDGPSFDIRNVRVYQPDDRTVFVAPTVEKTGPDRGRVHLRAELLFADTYDHSHEQTFGVRAEVDEYVYVLPFRWGSPFLADKTYEARAKIIEDGDAGWVDASERVSATPESDDSNRSETG
ncbi:hypothetical protein [Halovivax limisalsi]|uniref:hypothetical protein n=1 Tax=Halovivax limisalsi TaxID=1453760 RepID=UPI001FFC45D9|nr:hypothetical protein [Halovivax limisalsi]